MDLKSLHRMLGIVILGAVWVAAMSCSDRNNATSKDLPSPGTPAAQAPAAPSVLSPAVPPPGQPSAAPPAAPAAGDAKAEAEQIFQTRCVICHGASGMGDGVAGANLNPKPRNWTDKAWQQTVPDEQIEKVIVEGGPSIGKSPLMPPNPDLKEKPEVVRHLREKVRGFGAK